MYKYIYLDNLHFLRSFKERKEQAGLKDTWEGVLRVRYLKLNTGGTC